MEFKDYYSILGVSREATAEEIKKAFRQLARRYHPDVARDKAGADAKFKEVNEAYEVLGDPEKRRKYDELRTGWGGGHGFEETFEPHGPHEPAGSGARSGRAGPASEYHFEGTTGFSDFFEQFFGARAGAGFDDGFAPKPGFASEKGRDVEADFLLTIDEALRGSERLIRIQGQQGVRTLRVRIPRGIREGQRLRIAGQGGEDGERPGDLFLRIRLAAHPDYRVSGDDLHYDLTLAPWEAALGTTVTIPLPGDRQGRVTIPAGTSSGSRLRLRGLGLPRAKGAGDLFVTVAIAVPEATRPAERELWQKLQRETKFNPRE